MTGGLLPRRLPLFLVRLGRRWPRSVVAAAVLSWIVAAALATQVKVDTDLLSLVPRDNDVVSDFRTTIDRFGSLDTLLVVIRVGDGDDLEPTLAFAEIFAERLRSSELIDWVEYRMEDASRTAVPLLDRATLFLDEEEVVTLLDSLDGEGLRRQARSVKAQLAAPQSLVTKELFRLDPMGLVPRILDRVRIGGAGLSVDPQTGCLLDDERRFLLLLAKPVRPAQDIRFDRELDQSLSRLVQESREMWAEQGFEGEPPPVEFTGGYHIALADSELIVSDAVVGMGSSLIGVMFLFLLAFRRRSALVYAVVPLLTGLALSFAFISLALGRLNSLTSAFGGLLVGLGIDFIIVLYARYVEERKAGATHEEAVDGMGRHTGVGVLLGAVTTAGTFYSFLVTDFRGLWELGLLTGTGILLLVASVYLVLPALLSLLQDRTTRLRPHYLHSFGTDMVCRASLRHPTLVLGATLLVSTLFAVAMVGLRFDDDIRNMRSGDNRGILLQQEVMDAFGLRFTPMTVRVDGATDAEVLAAGKLVSEEIRQLVDAGVLASVDTIARVIPDLEEQLAVIRRLEDEAQVLDGLEARFAGAWRAEGLNPSAFVEGVGHLRSALELRQPLALGDLAGTTLERLVNRYVVRHDDGVSMAIYCYPPAGKWRRRAPPELAALVAGHDKVVLSGPNVVSAELRRIVWGDAIRAACLGLFIVFILMWVDLGSPVRSLLALVPLLVGMVWMLGAMALLGLRVNFMNIFVLTMIIGIGVDYGIHLLHRWYESGGNVDALAETAKAIAVAALTTMVGFGSLVLSHYPGLRSVGAAAILGAVFTALLSITLLPVLLLLIGRKHGTTTDH